MDYGHVKHGGAQDNSQDKCEPVVVPSGGGPGEQKVEERRRKAVATAMRFRIEAIVGKVPPPMRRTRGDVLFGGPSRSHHISILVRFILVYLFSVYFYFVSFSFNPLFYYCELYFYSPWAPRGVVVDIRPRAGCPPHPRRDPGCVCRKCS